MDHILVLRLSSLGDVLLTTPAIRALRNRFPTAKIDFLTKHAFAPLLQTNPYLSKVHTYPAPNLKTIRDLRKLASQYDLIVDLHGTLRSRLLSFMNGKTVRYKKYTLRRRLLTLFKLNLLKKVRSVPERYLEPLLRFGVIDDEQGLDYFQDTEAARFAKQILTQHRLTEKSYVALCPGAHWHTKKWPPERYQELIMLMPETRFVLLGNKREEPLCSRIAAIAEERAVNLAGKTEIAVSAEILRQARALVTNDTGLMHLACAVKTPVLALFGSTVRDFGFFPFRAKASVLEKTLRCRPCSTIGKAHCPKGTLECLSSLSAQETIAALKQLID